MDSSITSQRHWRPSEHFASLLCVIKLTKYIDLSNASTVSHNYILFLLQTSRIHRPNCGLFKRKKIFEALANNIINSKWLRCCRTVVPERSQKLTSCLFPRFICRSYRIALYRGGYRFLFLSVQNPPWWKLRGS